jgi:hypothetical protein
MAAPFSEVVIVSVPGDGALDALFKTELALKVQQALGLLRGELNTGE